MKRFTTIFLILCLQQATAQVRLPSLFGPNMVMQRNIEIPVWGWASPYEKVRAEFNGYVVEGVADSSGSWRVHLPAMKAGGPFELVVKGSNELRLTNVMVGIVWLCSGQSNMELSVAKAANAETEIASAAHPSIRLFTVKRRVADEPLPDCAGTWSQCSPQTVGEFSAVAYYFGRELQKQLGVAVGLIHSSYGGSPIEAWMTKRALDADSDFAQIAGRWRKSLAEYPEKKKEFDAQKERLMKEWDEASAKAAKEGKAAPARPQEPMGPGNRSTPSGLFNGMIAPVVPFAFDGVIWYQGEANVGRAHLYRKLFPALIRDWRSVWGRDFPFYYVQLPNLFRQPEPSRSGWAELRESQLMTLSVPQTAMAVTIDVGDPMNLHPQNKQAVGLRLALAAEAQVYGMGGIEFSGPLYKSCSTENSRVRIIFDHSGKLHSRDGSVLRGFVIAGETKKFVPAQTSIEGNTVVVWSDEIANPVSVRYAWGDNPDCNLVNDADLPASPFRTDDWPEVTFGRK